MSKEACVIKGSRKGLSLCISESVDFSDVLAELRAKLSSAEAFFKGASVRIQEDHLSLAASQRAQLEQIIEEFGLILEEEPVKEGESSVEEETLLVKRTIRSGQKVYHEGNVVVLGDVNPGAEIVCGGDILVLGALRGLAHAGVKGDSNAVVFAFRLEPTQLRIAQYISRAPDGKVPSPSGPEIAKVEDNLIQIHPYNH